MPLAAVHLEPAAAAVLTVLDEQRLLALAYTITALMKTSRKSFKSSY